MDTLNYARSEPSVLENLLHRNTKTEISNFEGSFRPCLFSHIESSSSFDSSFDDTTENFSEIIKEERPLSKSYKPESVLKASFLTEERNSPSFKDFEEPETRNMNEKKRGNSRDSGENEGKKQKTEGRRRNNEKSGQTKETNAYEFTDFYYAEEHNKRNLSSDIVVSRKRSIDPESSLTSYTRPMEKESVDGKFLSLIDLITQKDEEIKGLRTQVSVKDEELFQIHSKLTLQQSQLERVSSEKISLQTINEELKEKLAKSENQLSQFRLQTLELQKELTKLSSKAQKEDRVRQFSEDSYKRDKIEAKLKEVFSENEYLKQELQKRPSSNQYQSLLTRIEELEGLLSKRNKAKPDKSDRLIIKALLEMLKVDNPVDIVPAIKVIRHSGSSKLILRVSKLIQDCVPAGTFPKGPSNRDIWKFIRNVMEGYISLKKSENNMLSSKLQGCLGLRESANVFQEVMKIYNSLHFMELVFDKIKAKLGLSPHASLNDVEDAIENI